MKRPYVRLELEHLEDRIAPATTPAPTYYVTTGADNGNDANPTPGSIRAAIVAVINGKDNTINFSNVTESLLVGRTAKSVECG